jgi:hypothetical protein
MSIQRSPSGLPPPADSRGATSPPTSSPNSEGAFSARLPPGRPSATPVVMTPTSPPPSPDPLSAAAKDCSSKRWSPSCSCSSSSPSPPKIGYHPASLPTRRRRSRRRGLHRRPHHRRSRQPSSRPRTSHRCRPVHRDLDLPHRAAARRPRRRVPLRPLAGQGPKRRLRRTIPTEAAMSSLPGRVNLEPRHSAWNWRRTSDRPCIGIPSWPTA